MLTRRTALALGSALLAGDGLTRVAAAVEAPPSGGTLLLAGPLGPRHFNGAIQSGNSTAVPCTQIFASPLRFDENWKPQPYLAEAWEVAADGLSVTLHLVRTALFHDGVPVTSEDVAFTIDVIQKNHPFTTMLEPVTHVETPDPHTAIIRLKHPHPALILAMSPALMPILPKHVYGDGQDIQKHPANLKPVGAGPFRFVDYKPGSAWSLERNETYFIPERPAFDRIVCGVSSDSSVVTMAVERGDAQMVTFLSGVRDLMRIDQMPAVTTTAKGYDGIGALTWLAFNTQRAPFDDVRVRQAIAFASDRDAILKRLLAGKAGPSYGPIASGSPYATEDVEKYGYDVERANALLDAAGHPRGSDGTRFAMTIDSGTGQAELSRNLAEFLRQQLRKVGIAAEVRLAPDFGTWASRVSNYDYDCTLDTVFNWGDPVIGVHRTYLSTNIRKGVIWSNTQQYSNPEVDKLLANAAVENDETKRIALYHQFQKIVVRDAPIFFITEVPYHTVLNKGLADPPVTIWGPVSPMDTLRWETKPN